MSIRCGNHAETTYHATVNDVRACFAGAKGGEATYEDVILTDSETAKIAAGIREMESEGILPRRALRPADHPSYGRTATVTRPAPAKQLSPKGRDLPLAFQGSPKQYDYLADMCEELEIPLDGLVSLGRSQISNKIDTLKGMVRDNRLNKRHAAAIAPSGVKQTVTNSDAEVTEDGIYRNPETGEIFKVQVAVHGSGQLYAKQAYLDGLTPRYDIPLNGEAREDARVEWAYRPGLINKIRPEWRVTKAEAAAFGALYGRCIRCHRTLTREDSIERAMGPICSGKMGW